MTAPTVEVSPVVDAHVSTGAGVSGPISAPMVAALEGAWAAIRARHPEVPAVVLVLGAGSIGNAGGLRLGHFAAMRWADPRPDPRDRARPGCPFDGRPDPDVRPPVAGLNAPSCT